MKARLGFTLLELLVAMAILAILVLLLSGLIDGMFRGAGVASSNADRTERAGMIASRMVRDLKSTLTPLSGSVTNGPQFLLTPAGLSNVSRPQSVIFQAPVARDDAVTDIATVAYFARWLPGDPSRSVLCRLEVPLVDPSFLAGNWADMAFVDAHAPAVSTANPPFLGLLEENVLALWMRAVAEDGSLSYSYDSRVQGRLPTAVDFAFVVVDPQAAANLSTLPPFNAVNPANMEDEVQAFVNALPETTRRGARIFRASVSMAVRQP